jgi:hypothetical protein
MADPTDLAADITAELELRLQPNEKPQLTDAEWNFLVRVAVKAGVNIALAHGWFAKAGKVVGKNDTKAGDIESKQSQVHAMCMANARVAAAAAGVYLPGDEPTTQSNAVGSIRARQDL